MINSLFMSLYIIMLCLGPAFAAEQGDFFSPWVDSAGNISLPQEYSFRWIHLGTWVVTSKLPPGSGLEYTAPGPGFHDTYTQPTSLQAYKKTGIWPDGAVLIMEVRDIVWDDLPTGHVMREGEPLRWLMMVKDAKGRFRGNPSWGDGWGWALFKSAGTMTNSAQNYKNSCLPCHESPASSDFIFREGYPLLNERKEGILVFA